MRYKKGKKWIKLYLKLFFRSGQVKLSKGENRRFKGPEGLDHFVGTRDMFYNKMGGGGIWWSKVCIKLFYQAISFLKKY